MQTVQIRVFPIADTVKERKDRPKVTLRFGFSRSTVPLKVFDDVVDGLLRF